MLRDRQYLQDILDSATLAVQYLANVPRDAFLQDVEKQDAVVRRIEIMGEAAKRVSEATTSCLPEIDWRRMKGMRDVLVHDYDAVDAERVWDTVETYLPQLIATVSAYLKNTPP